MESLRKFGLEYCDLPTMISNVAFMWRFLLLDIDSRDKKSIPVLFYIVFVVVALCFFYVYLISMVWYITCCYPKNGDILAAIIVFSLSICSQIGTVKLIFIHFYIEKVRSIVDDCLECDASVIPGTRFSNNLIVILRYVKKRTIIFWIVIIGNGVVYIAKPLLIPGRHIMEDVFILYGLEPTFETPNFQITFMLMMTGITWTCFLPANITAFLIIVTGYAEAQTLAISEELSNLWDDALNYYHDTKPNSNNLSNELHEDHTEDDTEKSEIINDYITENLKKVIKTHTSILNILKQIEFVYSGAIATEFGILGIGLITALLGGLENTYIQMPFALMQVGMDCFTGQRVMDASLVFRRAVYDCKWEKFNLTNMKIVMVMLQNTQKVMSLSAGSISTLSFNCMLQVIRSVYSAFTTLRSTMK